MEQSPAGLLYDVSLEEVVIKALPEADLPLVPADELRALLMALVGKAQAHATMRQALLRQRYVAFLTKALADLEQPASGSPASRPTRYGVGDRVAIQEGAALLLGVVRAVSMARDEVLYDVECLGDRVRLGERRLQGLELCPSAAPFQLGERVRFLTPNYEQSEEFLGVVCSLEQEDGKWSYAIEFDDGDVLEGLSPNDLARVS